VWEGIKTRQTGKRIGRIGGWASWTSGLKIGRSYGTEASTNLFHWTRVDDFTNLCGFSRFIDSASTNMNRRFYRTDVP
jgi:hypothetical protein